MVRTGILVLFLITIFTIKCEINCRVIIDALCKIESFLLLPICWEVLFLF